MRAVSSRFPFRRTRARPDEPLLPFGGRGSDPDSVTVSAYVTRLNSVLKAALPETWVKGELADFRVWSSGHAYFTLKDAFASLPAVIWASDLARVPFRPEAGMEILARGRPDVWAKTGKLSLVVSELQPVGVGALQLAFEQLKARLQAEGLLDVARKRPLPLLPRRIGLVTSRHGAAVRDVLKVLRARFPNAHVTLFPVAVQGEGAPAEIVRALEALSRARAADVVIVTRGGGSKEDLAAFNDERVARAIAACPVPTISAVGHEVDVTLADLVADVRAATPSHAAELVVARRDQFDARIEGLGRELVRALRSRLLAGDAELARLAHAPSLAGLPGRAAARRERLESLARALVAAIRGLPAAYGERLARAEGRLGSFPARAALPLRAARVGSLASALVDRLGARRDGAERRLAAVAGALQALSPLRVLARGYSITYHGEARSPLTDPAGVAPGDPLRIVLARGELRARAAGTVRGGEE